MEKKVSTKKKLFKAEKELLKSIETLSDDAAINALVGIVRTFLKLPEEQRIRLRGKIRADQSQGANQELMSAGLMLDAVGVLKMDNFSEVINQERQAAPAAPVITTDDLDQAQLDLNFVSSVLDVFFTITGGRMDELQRDTVCNLSSAALEKVSNVKKFMDSAERKAV